MASKDEVAKFVSDTLGIPIRLIKDDSSLNHDLKVDGGDAVDFINAFSKRYVVDISEFVFSDYFGGEICANPIGLLVRIIRASNGEFKRLEVRKLVDATLSKRLR